MKNLFRYRFFWKAWSSIRTIQWQGKRSSRRLQWMAWFWKVCRGGKSNHCGRSYSRRPCFYGKRLWTSCKAQPNFTREAFLHQKIKCVSRIY